MNDADLVSAYRRTRYEIRLTPPVRVQIGAPVARALSSTAILTAYNPASEIRTADTNARADARLGDVLAAWGVPPIRSIALDPDGGEEWTEPGFAVRGLPRVVVVELAETFGQNAIVWIGGDAVARLVVTRRGFAGLPLGASIRNDAPLTPNHPGMPHRSA